MSECAVTKELARTGGAVEREGNTMLHAKRVPHLRLVASALALALLSIAAPCIAATLRVAVSDGPVSLPIYVAQTLGYFVEEHLELQLSRCPSGLACLRTLSAATADVATAAEMPVAMSSSVENRLAILATISSSSHQIKLVGRRSTGVTKPNSLDGKRVGTVLGSSAQYFLENWLVFHEVNPRGVHVIGLEPGQLIQALESRSVDAIAIWEPIASESIDRIGSDAIELQNPRVYTQYFNLVCRHSASQALQVELSAMLRALVRAQRFIEQHPTEAGEILKNRLHVSQALANAALRDEDFRVRLDQSLLTTMSSELRWAARNSVPGSPAAVQNPLSLIDSSVLSSVAPDSVRLAR